MPWGIIGGSLIGGLFASKGQKSANEASAQSVEKQIAWQREQAKNRYQWTTQDMRQAGINPMMASGVNPPVQSGAAYEAKNEMEGLAKGVQSGLALAHQKKQLQLQTKLGEAQLAKIQAEKEDIESKTAARYWDKMGGNIEAQTLHHSASAGEARARIPLIKEQAETLALQRIKMDSEIQKVYEEIENLQQQVRESKTREGTYRAEVRLKNAQAKLTDMKERSEILTGNLRMLDIEGRKLGLKVLEMETKGKSTPFGRFMRERGYYDAIGNIVPFMK